jgi:hypothetical protein
MKINEDLKRESLCGETWRNSNASIGAYSLNVITSVDLLIQAERFQVVGKFTLIFLDNKYRFVRIKCYYNGGNEIS